MKDAPFERVRRVTPYSDFTQENATHAEFRPLWNDIGLAGHPTIISLDKNVGNAESLPTLFSCEFA